MATKPLYLLKNASFYYDQNDTERAMGEVYGHPMFSDGESIITSEIIGFDVPNNIVETLNSRYEIQNWQRRDGDKDEGFTSEDEIREMFGWFQKSFRGEGICERA